jgi:hypothetical protein
MNYQQEQQEWDKFITQEVGVNAKLLNVSLYSSDCRIYSLADSIFKIRRLTPASMRFRLNSLEDEYLILSHLKSISAVPKPLHYKRLGMWEIIEMTAMSPLPAHDPTFGAPRESMKDFMEVIKFAWSINKLGCSHGDLHGHNIGRNVQGELSAFDFDQAIIGNPILCWLRDFLGIGTYARPTDISLLRRARSLRIIFPLLKVYQLSKQLLRTIIRRNGSNRIISTFTRINLKDHVVLLNDHKMNLLAEAWVIASKSNASSPETPIAYYSLDIDGINFPGERPWILRWHSIKQKIDFKGKKLLELGCNLGLLSIHAKIIGASSCLGIDIDPDIVRAASLAAYAFETEVKFKQLNLDDSFKWEDELAGYDIVSALSVMHWVKNKERLWAFLSKQKEVLYEGHESDTKSAQNLKKAGFTKISVIGQSERGRNIFHAISVPRIINY